MGDVLDVNQTMMMQASVPPKDTLCARNLVELLAQNAAHDPDKPFMVDASGATPPLSFGATFARARYFAAAFAARGIGPGQIVALMLPTEPESQREAAPAFFGAMMLGAVPAFFPALTSKQDPAIFWSSHEAVFRRIKVGLIISDGFNIGLIATHLPEFAGTCFDIAGHHLVAPNLPDYRAEPDDTAFLQHSSGTTGLKKGVMLTHRAVAEHVATLAQTLALTRADRVISWLPLYHDMGLIGCFILPVILGLTVISLDPLAWVRRPASLLEAMTRYRPTVTWQPNFAFHLLMRAAGPAADYDLSSLRAVIDCSEPCKPETLTLFRDHFAQSGLRPTAVQVSYAMAETVFAVTQTQIETVPRVIAIDAELYLREARAVPCDTGQASRHFISCGPALPGVELAILGADGAWLPAGGVGEIVVKTPTLFAGYFGIETPAEKFHQGWYRTGDLGFIDAGELFVTGRKDDLMIVHGKNIYAHDVEFTINTHCAVKPGRVVAVAPYNPQTGSQALVVMLEAEVAGAAAPAALTRSIKAAIDAEYNLAVYEVMILEPGSLIKTTSGKISRRENLLRYCAVRPNLQAYTA